MSDNSSYKTPPFEHLIGAYFHQDWNLDSSSATEALDRFARENPPTDVAAARDAAQALLARGLPEDELEAQLDAYYLGYNPIADGLSHREWLQSVVETLDAYVQ